MAIRNVMDHVSIGVNNYEASRDFYDETLKILGIHRVANYDEHGHLCCSYGIKRGKGVFYISNDPKQASVPSYIQGVHFAFVAKDQVTVQAWYKRCLELGAEDNGAPGYRKRYGPGYYAAFVIDRDGWRIEAMLREKDVAGGKN